MNANISRRIDVTRNTPAELVIRKAVNTVEELPADQRLTDAVLLLSEARERVADYVDSVQRERHEILAVGDRFRISGELLTDIAARPPGLVETVFIHEIRLEPDGAKTLLIGRRIF